MKAQHLLLLFLIGAITGSLLDAFHVYSNIEHYPTPVFMGLAWWVPLLFGGATVAIGYSHPMIDPLLHNRRPSKHMMSSMAESGWIVLAYLISASTLGSMAKAAFLWIIYFNFWLLAGIGWQNLLLSLVTAITGTLVEMVLVAGGAFSYLHPDFIGVPYWLPCMYACASLAVGDLGRSLLVPTTRG